MLAPDRSNFGVRVAKRAERETAGIQLLCSTAGRLLPVVPVLVYTEQIRELSLDVIEHGSFVNGPALPDHSSFVNRRRPAWRSRGSSRLLYASPC